MTSEPAPSPRTLRIDRVRVPFRQPFRTARGDWEARESWIVRVQFEDGAERAGEVPVPFGGMPEAAPSDAALEAAVADAVATASCPVAGPAADVGVNATIEAAGADRLAAAAVRAVGEGFRTLKVKVGGEASSAELVERVRAVRDAVGPATRVRLDANGAWDEVTAIERLRAVAPLDLELVEQPVEPGDAEALARVRRAGGVPVAADEGVSSLADAERLLLAGAVDALVVKPSRVGGWRGASRIGELALSAGVPVVVSTMFETGIGLGVAACAAARLAAITPPGVPQLDHGLATADLLLDDLAVGLPRPEGGRLRALAAVPDADAIERYRVAAPIVRELGA